MSLAKPFNIELWQPDPSNLDSDIAMLGDLLHDCVKAGAAVSFVLPFSRDEAARFWRNQVFTAVESGTCCVLVARCTGAIAGTVQFDLATPPNQPHRAEVKKLLVHPNERRNGIARALMLALEDRARELGRTLLTLDTASAGAEQLYSSLGYVRVGVIPGYSRKPDSPELEGTTIMYKELNA
ncbi:MAG TPA: GNAT family N-acetyltransferase [Pyrinomonadaceae bacterium]|nr:GNAT family N-acetyltransferase [Pyrinomonadaceae bacterium]